MNTGPGVQKNEMKAKSDMWSSNSGVILYELLMEISEAKESELIVSPLWPVTTAMTFSGSVLM